MTEYCFVLNTQSHSKQNLHGCQNSAKSSLSNSVNTQIHVINCIYIVINIVHPLYFHKSSAVIICCSSINNPADNHQGKEMTLYDLVVQSHLTEAE